VRAGCPRSLRSHRGYHRGELTTDKKEVIAARLAEWGLTMSESELAQLVPAYDNLMRWQTVLEDMLQTRKIADGMVFPQSEPMLVPSIEKKGAPR
jgi:hypothetical protein